MNNQEIYNNLIGSYKGNSSAVYTGKSSYIGFILTGQFIPQSQSNLYLWSKVSKKCTDNTNGTEDEW